MYIVIILTCSKYKFFTTVAPEITSHTADTEFHRGGTITLHCTARGHPVPVVTWLKDGELIVADGRISQPTTSSLTVSVAYIVL